jgi:hypothetical protein
MSFLSLWKRIFGVDSKSPREQFKESYSKGVIRKINPQSYQEGSHDQEGVIDPGKTVLAEEEGEIVLTKYEPADHLPEKLSDAEVTHIKAKRARTAKGRYKGDDKSTPDVNEAWEGGKAPKKKDKKKKKKK